MNVYHSLIIEKVFRLCGPSFLKDMVDVFRFSKITPSLVRNGMILVFERYLGTEYGRSRWLTNRRTRVMKLKMTSEGKSDFRVPHTTTDKRIRKGESIEEVHCTEEDVAKARNFLSRH